MGVCMCFVLIRCLNRSAVCVFFYVAVFIRTFISFNRVLHRGLNSAKPVL